MARGAAGVIALGPGRLHATTRPSGPPRSATWHRPACPSARSAVVQQPPGLLGSLVDRLQQDSFAVTHLDEQRGLVVVHYSGDPEPYV